MEHFPDVCGWEKLFWAIVGMMDDLVVYLTEEFGDLVVAIFTLDDFDFGTGREDYGNGGSLPADLAQFRHEASNAHNNLRTLHGCQPLALSEELSATAQAWADRLADKGFLQYSENPSLGENISLVDLDQSSKKGDHIVKEWYKEISNYNYSKPGWRKGAHRFSQLLWKSTTEMGVGVARVRGHKSHAYVVVHYRPAGNGNMPGEFERNVLPPQKLTHNAHLAGKVTNRR